MGMMWTTENRPRYNRDKLRYPSDLTNEEWGHVEPLIPPAKRGGRRREVDERELLNGLLYVLSTGVSVALYPQGLAAAKYLVRLLPTLGVRRNAVENSL
jgi:transposase